MIAKIIFYIALSLAAFLQGEETPVITVQVPMRDGMLLPTDLYLPYEGAKDLPCILIRSPAGRRQMTAINYVPLAKHGYVVAIQSTRSSMDAAGKTLPYRSDGWNTHQDGYDTVEWLAKYPLTNGRVGTLGFSAQGITQLLMAPSAPPSLQCQYIGAAAPTLRDHAIFPNGKLLKHQVEMWLAYYAGDTGVFSFVANQQFYDEFWEEFDSLKIVEKVKAPAIFLGGWYDIFIQGTLDAFAERQKRGGEGAKGKQKLVVGPWTHFWPDISKIGDFEIPEGAKQPPIDVSPLRWFNHYLKDMPNDMQKIPPVIYYVMGPFDGSPSCGNVWRFADEWPVPAIETPFYLTMEGFLASKSPTEEDSEKQFIHDPLNFVPTIGGHNLFIDSGPMDQSPIESRDDVVVFSSSPLTEDLEVTGRIKAKLFVSSDCVDTDFVVRLTDVYPDGRSILITDGAFRTGLLSLPTTARDPQQKHEIEVDLNSTSVAFAKGHRIRISVCGSNYPRYQLNLNVGLLGGLSQGNVKAHNKIHLGKDSPSRLLLPVTKGKGT